MVFEPWDKWLKLGIYVLGTKTKFLNGLNFDQGLRCENLKFWNFWWPKNHENRPVAMVKCLIAFIPKRHSSWYLKICDSCSRAQCNCMHFHDLKMQQLWQRTILFILKMFQPVAGNLLLDKKQNKWKSTTDTLPAPLR